MPTDANIPTASPAPSDEFRIDHLFPGGSPKRAAAAATATQPPQPAAQPQEPTRRPANPVSTKGLWANSDAQQPHRPRVPASRATAATPAEPAQTATETPKPAASALTTHSGTLTTQPPKSKSRLVWILTGIGLLAATAIGITVAAIMFSDQPAQSEQLVELNAAEASLRSEIEATNTHIAAAVAEKRAGETRAAQTAAELAKLQPVTDATAFAAAQQAHQRYADTLANITTPARAPAYLRPAFDATDAEEVQTAISNIGARMNTFAPMLSAADAATTAIAQAEQTFAAAMRTFNASFPAYADRLITAFPYASKTHQQALTAAAKAVAASDPLDPANAEAWNTYFTAARALQDDHTRAAAEETDATDPELYEGDGEWVDPGSGGGVWYTPADPGGQAPPSDPGTPPVEEPPVVEEPPSPEPSDPGDDTPIDPGPVDPGELP